MLGTGHLTDPHLQRQGGHSPRSGVHNPRISGIELPGLALEFIGGCSSMLGRSSQKWNHVTSGHLLEKWHDFMSDSISLERRIFIAWVVEWIPIESTTHLDRVRSSQREKGATRSGSHRAKAPESGAPEQVDQHCLRLIIGCVTRRRVGSEHLVSGSSHARFEIRPGLHLHRGRLEDNSDLRACIRDPCCFFWPGWTLTVVNMDRGDLTASRNAKGDQRE